MKVLDLFSGIGAFSLGLERAGMQTAAFCEIEEFPRKVLRKHWPGVRIYEDIRQLTAKRLASDGIEDISVIAGGFPCQDISLAGHGAGINGERSGLWSEMARLIGELRPKYAIMENVSALLGRGLGDVLRDLAEIGYDAEWHCIPASSIGAPHHRDRVWILAHPCGEGLSGFENITSQQRMGHHSREAGRFWGGWEYPECPVLRVVNGDAARLDRNALKALGNSLVPQIPEIIGRAIMEVEHNDTQ